MAGREFARTTGLYDRRSDAVALDEVERIVIRRYLTKGYTIVSYRT